jgi:hypothetical protein
VKAIAALALLWLTPLASAQTIAAPKRAEASPNLSATAASPAAQAASASRATAAAAQDAPSKPAAKVEPQKEAAIRKLFEVQGTRKALQEVIAGMTDTMRPTLTKSLPPGEYRDKLIELFFQKFQANMKLDDLLALNIPVYDKYFSMEEIAGLTQFYQTPLGQKVSSALPKIAVEIQAAATKMGEELGRRSMLEVMAEHPELEKALEDAAAGKN